MKEEIYKICTKLNDGQIAVVEAQEQLLLLFSVSCQCDACKQDRIDSDYRKYLELSKNVIGYD